MGKSLFNLAGDVVDGVFFLLSFFPRDVLNEIWDLIESVFEVFPTYFSLEVLLNFRLTELRNQNLHYIILDATIRAAPSDTK